MKLYQWQPKEGTNFGDELSKVVVEWITKEPAEIVGAEKTGKLIAIGSLIHELKDLDTVWGAGLHPYIIRKLDAKAVDFKMVRGKITRDYLISQGFSVPKVYGDPATLLPLVYNPAIEKKKKVGVIPHINDIGKFTDFIDVRKDWKEVVNEILVCEKIVSSSLHGLIVAEAYGIPAVWLKSKEAGDLKFQDYYSATNRQPVSVNTVEEAEKINPVVPKFNTQEIIDSFTAPSKGFIDNYFDKIYVINLDRRTGRWEEIQKQLKEANITNVKRISGVVVTEFKDCAKFKVSQVKDKQFETIYVAGALGARKAHLNCIQDAKDSGYQKVLILEDDVIISKDANKLFANAISQTGNNWDIFYLGGDYWQTGEIFQASSYALDKRLFNTILDNAERSGEEIDFFYLKYIQPHFKLYKMNPIMVQNKKDSDIPTELK